MVTCSDSLECLLFYFWVFLGGHWCVCVAGVGERGAGVGRWGGVGKWEGGGVGGGGVVFIKL